MQKKMWRVHVYIRDGRKPIGPSIIYRSSDRNPCYGVGKPTIEYARNTIFKSVARKIAQTVANVNTTYSRLTTSGRLGRFSNKLQNLLEKNKSGGLNPARQSWPTKIMRQSFIC